MKFYIGVDGGGTKTRLLIANQKGKIIGQGESGPGNYQYVGLPAIENNLKQAARIAWKNAGLSPQIASRAFLGMAGIKSNLDRMRIQTVAEKIKLAETGNIQVENDLSNALAGGLGGQPGIAVISGTGSNTLGCDEQNNVRMCGGWQWLLDDEGGGVGISIEAIRLSTRSWDGELPKTTLIPSLLAFFGIRDLNEILECLYLKSWTPDFLAKLTPVVMEHAQAGDLLALQCLKKGATRLANQVKTLSQHLQFKKSKKIPVILLGGCVEKNTFYRHMIEKEIQKKKIFRIQKPLFSTAQGAIIQALKPTSIQPLFSKKKYL